jgi:hypothetical protein
MARFAMPLLAVFGLALIIIGVAAGGPPDAVRTALVVMGAGATTLALVRYELEGDVKVTASGFEGRLRDPEYVTHVFEGALAVAAEKLPEDEPVTISVPSITSEEAVGPRIIIQKHGGVEVKPRGGEAPPVSEAEAQERGGWTLSDEDAFKKTLATAFAHGLDENINECANCGLGLYSSDPRPCPRCGSTERRRKGWGGGERFKFYR